MVLLPAMLGPVTRSTRSPSLNRTSFGMNASRGIIRSTTGCRLARSINPNPSVTTGRT
jgi:hypothetical protein